MLQLDVPIRMCHTPRPVVSPYPGTRKPLPNVPAKSRSGATSHRMSKPKNCKRPCQLLHHTGAPHQTISLTGYGHGPCLAPLYKLKHHSPLSCPSMILCTEHNPSTPVPTDMPLTSVPTHLDWHPRVLWVWYGCGRWASSWRLM